MLYEVLKMSEEIGGPILVTTEAKKNLYLQLAELFDIHMPVPVVLSDYDKYEYDVSCHYQDAPAFVADDPETLLAYIIKHPITCHNLHYVPSKKTLTKSEALYLLGFNPEEYEIIDD